MSYWQVHREGREVQVCADLRVIRSSQPFLICSGRDYNNCMRKINYLDSNGSVDRGVFEADGLTSNLSVEF